MARSTPSGPSPDSNRATPAAKVSTKKTATKKTATKKTATKKAAPKKTSAGAAGSTKRTSPGKAVPRKASTSRASRSTSPRQGAQPNPQSNQVPPTTTSGVSDFLSQAAGVMGAVAQAWPDVVSQANRQVRHAATRAQELARTVHQEASAQAAHLSHQANEQLERGKQFVRKHPEGVMLSALAAATVAGLAAGRATYKSVRRHK